MKMRIIAAIALCLCLTSALASAQEVEFNYEGLVKIDGIPYNGPGYFKFSIVNKQGDVTLWSNDGTVAGGVEPATAVSVDVLDGVFNVIIGDASTANMGPLVASIFNAKEKVFLRVWFSDSLAGPYEQLLPDRAITNPALLGSQLFTELDLYVDPVLGDDKYPGNHPTHPKRTIQSAWNTLPALINENATIHLAEGIYRESVDMRGKSVIGDATISIIGNPSSPNTVRVTGADSGAETTSVRETGFNAVSQTHLYIDGIRFDNFSQFGVLLYSGSSGEIRNCVFVDNFYGVRLTTSEVVCSDCDFTRSVFPLAKYPSGFVMGERSIGRIKDCTLSNLRFGVRFNNSYCRVDGCTISNNSDYGFFVEALSHLVFGGPQSTVSNNPVAVYAMQNSVVTESTFPNYSGNGTIMTLISGAVRD